jgi:uncharacterized protein involved in outer membrane biogenesis
MAENTTAPALKKRFRWFRLLLWCALALVLVLVIGFFVLTSQSFVKGVILPKVGAAMNAKVSADTASVGLSGVDFKNFKVVTTGVEPLFAVQELRLKYSLGAILGGNINVDEVYVNSPRVVMVTNPDGSNNLPKSSKSEPEKQPSAPSKSSKPLQINVKKVEVANASVLTIKNYANGSKDVTEVTNFNFLLQNLANGQTGTMKISSGFSMDNNPPQPGTNGAVQAKMAGEYTFALGKDLSPESIKGNLGLDVEKATGAFADAAGLSTTLTCDATPAELKEVAIRAKKGGATLAELLVSGPFSLEKKEGAFNVQLSGVDKKLLNLSGKDFGQTKISSTNRIFVTNQNIAVTGRLSVNQFSMTQSNQTLGPIDLGATYDVAKNGNIIQIPGVTLALTPTERGKNSLTLSGKVDMSDTNAMQGNLKLLAESLDLNAYYDMFMGKPQAAAAKPAQTNQPAPAAKPATTATASAKADENKPLPFKNFTVDANIGRIFLKEIAISNLQTQLKLDQTKVAVQPFQLALNGAPVSSTVDLDLGVPGYQYKVEFKADRIPLKPLVNSFVPERKDMINGEIVADTKIQGAGTSGADLQKNLKGSVQFGLTNANLDLLDPMFQKYLGPLAKFLQPIATLLTVPELVKTPIQQVNFATQVEQGTVNVKTMNVVSPAFALDTAGTMTLTPALTNSPLNNWPVNFYLSRNLAQKIDLVPSGTPADAKLVKLPNFLSVGGTLGSPDPQVNKTALAGTLLEKYLPKIPGIGEKGGSLLQGLGGLGGLLPGTTSTNQTATNAPSVGGVLQGVVGGLLGGSKPAATNTPPQTNQPNRGINPLDLFRR